MPSAKKALREKPDGRFPLTDAKGRTRRLLMSGANELRRRDLATIFYRVE
jgi:hypothetical protein